LYPRWERGYRRHAYYIDEITAVAGVGIAPPPQIGREGTISMPIAGTYIQGIQRSQAEKAKH
jgi:hypothetical protein